MNKLSIIIPCFNEENSIELILERIKGVELNYNIEKQLIIIDDCSTDKTVRIIEGIIDRNKELDILFLKQDVNRGKGAAIKKGISKANGDLIIIQDADLEYDPDEYNLLIEPIVQHRADVVYGARFNNGNPHRILFFWHTIGNKFLTFLSNALSNLNLSDMETCYKMFRRDVLEHIQLEENRFGFEPEITAKVSKLKGIRIYEVGISYYGRSYEEGKKISWQDGFRAIYCVIKYNIFR